MVARDPGRNPRSLIQKRLAPILVLAIVIATGAATVEAADKVTIQPTYRVGDRTGADESTCHRSFGLCR